MPYFIYKISSNNELRALESFDKFPDAKKRVRALREDSTARDEHTFRIIFAGDTEAAERLLREKREPSPGED
uniref:Uncharacterized protein n=1 Tax=Candidatus Kentrum sp. FM TaxID=2126340 RepID=A0A450T403_9GAMM|nr:MAG: hypothetical protein BECKFM1743C_GA0114222_102913 [Candidatus Kentron sp. FM]VFJ76772.1 MAG: hypothetical protein BECKFM1743A_GA0114220_109441 [Candidatus Kentron sp. FM]VFK21201.1 MAG: hypothetical protein BECKFM1743B_GA0114221_107661 [Candidatus Kentron sp. FM]